MIEYDASSAQCLVYSFKEGLLSKLAHDLKHRVTRFSVRVDEQTRAVEAEIDARSLRVECVMNDGVEKYLVGRPSQNPMAPYHTDPYKRMPA